MHLRVAHITPSGGYQKPVKQSKKELIHQMALASIAERRVINKTAAVKKFAERLQCLEQKENQLLANDKYKV